MHRLKVMLAFLLLVSCGVPFAGAAGVGTFSIEQTTVNVGVNQFGVATLYMDNTWDPPADSAILYVGWDPAIIQYVSTDWKIGNSLSATLNSPGELKLQYADWANKYPSGRVPVADINFRGVAEGQTTVGIRIESVRSHAGTSATEFTELTQSSLSNPGIFTVGQGGGGAITTVPTLPGTTTGTIAPTANATTVAPTVIVPTDNVTGLPTPTVTGVIPTGPLPTDTGNVTVVPTMVTTMPTGISTGVPLPPSGGSGTGSDEYTGVVTRTATPTATTTATMTTTGTPDGTATPGVTPTDGGTEEQTVMDLARANPNLSTLVTAIEEAGLDEVLAGAGPFTVFAPTDAAFDALPPATLDALLQDREELTSVLTYHVAAGRFTSDNLTATQVVRTVQGENVNVTVEAGRVRVDGAMVTQADIQGSNGVIHVIDAVLLPPAGNATPTMTGTAITTAPAETGTVLTATTVPVNTTATAAGADSLPLVAVSLIAALAIVAARRR
jgi:uncharacterized surface protein with fasciclin (FAS1) repeats